MNDLTKNIVVFVVILVVLLSVAKGFGPGIAAQQQERPYSEFLQQIDDGQVGSVLFQGDRISYGSANAPTSAGYPYFTMSPESSNDAVISTLHDKNIQFRSEKPEEQGFLTQLFISSFPILLLIGVWIYFMRQMQGANGGRGAMSFGKSRARLLGEDQVNVTFADVAGIDESKEELQEIVEFLRDPRKFTRLGGRIPKGVLGMR
ncbi:MAG: ATP-dependent metallopeptidase FtsH/Yme1/Tma family protein, partial [Pseudomonadota bacterium]